TGYGREEDRRRSREAGMDLHLVKPVDPKVLLKLLRGIESGYMPSANRSVCARHTGCPRAGQLRELSDHSRRAGIARRAVEIHRRVAARYRKAVVQVFRAQVTAAEARTHLSESRAFCRRVAHALRGCDSGTLPRDG